VKSNVLLLGPAFLLALLALGVTGLAFQYVLLTRKLNQAQSTLAQIEMSQNRIKALVNECVEYSHKNPEILPILQSIGLKPTQAHPALTNSLASPNPNGR